MLQVSLLLMFFFGAVQLPGHGAASGPAGPSATCPCRHLQARVRKFTRRHFNSSRYRLHKIRIESRLSAGDVHVYMLIIPSTRTLFNRHVPVICRDTAFFATLNGSGIGADSGRVRQVVNRVLLSPTPPDTATINTVHALFQRGSYQYPKEGVHIHWR